MEARRKVNRRRRGSWEFTRQNSWSAHTQTEASLQSTASQAWLFSGLGVCLRAVECPTPPIPRLSPWRLVLARSSHQVESLVAPSPAAFLSRLAASPKVSVFLGKKKKNMTFGGYLKPVLQFSAVNSPSKTDQYLGPTKEGRIYQWTHWTFLIARCTLFPQKIYFRFWIFFHIFECLLV